MSYYLRAFCTTDELPSLRRVCEWALNEGIALELDNSSDPLDDENWRHAEIRYSADRQPLVVSASRARTADELLSDEVEEFVEFLEDVQDSPEKQTVLAQLLDSRAIVDAELLGDINDDAYNAVGTFLRYFVEHCGAMIQADGEGFYEGDRVLVALE